MSQSVATPLEPAPGHATEAVLELRQVVKNYADSSQAVAVLQGADLILRRGERVALLGPSGSGKTTLLNIAAGLEPCDAGQVLLAGQDLGQLSEHQRSLWRRRHLGFVFQSFNLFPQLDARANIRVSLRLNGLRGSTWDTAVDELMARLNIQQLARRYPHQMSGGEQQRVAIARALVHRPQLILADEPTGNLDQAHAAEVLELLAATSAGCALLLVTHSQRAARRCDRILRLNQGQLVSESHPAAEL